MPMRCYFTSSARLTMTRSAKNSRNSVLKTRYTHISGKAERDGRQAYTPRQQTAQTIYCLDARGGGGIQKASFYGQYAKKRLKIWKITKLCLSLQCQDECFDYPVSFRVGARLNRHYSSFIKESLLLVALLLFCIAPNECAEEIVIIQTPSRYGDLLHALKQQDFTRIGIQFEITLYTTCQCSRVVIGFHV